MKVSVITVVYNAADTIEDCINNVRAQTYPNIEHIIIDGGSKDGTTDIIEKHKDSIAKYICEKDNGVYNAMNKGINLAQGQVIGFLNADDTYASETVISEIVAFIRENCLDAAYGDIVYVDRADTERVVRYWQPGAYQPGAFCRGWVPPHPSFYCRKEIFEKFGCFNDNFRIAADFELMLRFIEKHKINVGYLPKVIVKMRTGGRANVICGIIRGNGEIIKSFKLNGLCISPMFFVCKPIEKIGQVFKKPKAG